MERLLFPFLFSSLYLVSPNNVTILSLSLDVSFCMFFFPSFIGKRAFTLTLEWIHTLILERGFWEISKELQHLLSCCNRFKNCHCKKSCEMLTYKTQTLSFLGSFNFASSPRSWELYLFTTAISSETWFKRTPCRSFPWIHKPYYNCSISLRFISNYVKSPNKVSYSFEHDNLFFPNLDKGWDVV